MASWVSAGHGVAEFWECSPAQIHHVLKAHGLIKKKGTIQDALAIFGRGRGVRLPKRPPP